MNNNIKNITVFTDGSCVLKNNNINHGGIGVCFDNEVGLKNISKSFMSEQTTNQSMELMACLAGVEKVIKFMSKKEKIWALNIYTDSMYVINCINEWAPKWIQLNWQRRAGAKLKEIKHLKIIKKLYRLSKLYPINYHHVRSHQKEPSKNLVQQWTLWNGNNVADKLAGNAMRKC